MERRGVAWRRGAGIPTSLDPSGRSPPLRGTAQASLHHLGFQDSARQARRRARLSHTFPQSFSPFCFCILILGPYQRCFQPTSA